jgi:hypothetical protein
VVVVNVGGGVCVSICVGGDALFVEGDFLA